MSVESLRYILYLYQEYKYRPHIQRLLRIIYHLGLIFVVSIIYDNTVLKLIAEVWEHGDIVTIKSD